VATGIPVAGVGLDLDEPDGKPSELRVVVDEQLVEQIRRELTESRAKKTAEASARRR